MKLEELGKVTKTKKPKGESQEVTKQEKLETQEKVKSELPPLPGPKGEGSFIPSSSEEEEGISEAEASEDLKRVCGALASTGFLIWRIFDKDITPLDNKQAEAIGNPLADCALKYKFDRYVTVEINLAVAVGTVVAKKMREKKDKKVKVE